MNSIPALLFPQAQAPPALGAAFSVAARSHVHSCAGRAPIPLRQPPRVLVSTGKEKVKRWAGRTTTAASAFNPILGPGFIAVAFQRGLLPARAGCLGSADAGGAGAATAG